MPKDTFYRLSPDKKKRITDAANEEFHRVPYSQVSINKIIKTAGISRGSFYQYFEDKKDLFGYLLSENGAHMVESVYENLKKVQGDLFEFAYLYIDKFIENKDIGLLYFDEELIRLIIQMCAKKNIFEDIEKKVEMNFLGNVNFDHIDVEGHDEKIHLMKIIGSIFHESASRMMHPEFHTDPLEVCEDMKCMLKSLERHYKIK